jgi:hypothetical protein
MNAEIKSTGIIGQFTVTVADIHTPAEQEFTLKQLRLKLSAESVTYTNIEKVGKGEYFRLYKGKKVYTNKGYCKISYKYLKKGTIVEIDFEY